MIKFSGKKMKAKKVQAWKEAKRRCRLNAEDIRMAKELGFGPRSLIKNIPNPSQKWKAPVKEWIRSLHAEKFAAGKRAGAPQAPVDDLDLAIWMAELGRLEK